MMHHACAASLLNPSPRLPLPPDLALIRGWEWEWRPPQRPSLLQTKILLKGLTVQVWWEKAELEGRQVERGWYPALFQPEKFDTEEGTREQLLSIKYLGCGTEEDLYWDNLCGRPFGECMALQIQCMACQQQCMADWRLCLQGGA